MRRKERPRPTSSVFVQVFNYGPSDRNTVISRRASTQLVEEYETTLREIVHNVGRLTHLHHKRTLAHRDIVAGADARKDLVDHTDLRLLSRHKSAHLRE